MEQQERETKHERLEELDGQIYLKIIARQKIEQPLVVGEITGDINADRIDQGYKTKITARKVGNVIRKIMGIKSERMNDGYHLIMTPRKNEELNTYYGVSITSTPSSQSSPEEELDPDSLPF